MSFDPTNRKFYSAKTKGIEVVSNLDYLDRRGIVFKWDSRLFDGNVFGSEVGPVNCFLSGGFHDFSHALDFIMMGRGCNVHRYGLTFNRQWANTVYIAGRWYDDMPKTAQATNSELRTFALQAYLLHREAGEILDTIDYIDEDEARAAGYLSDFPDRKAEEHRDSIYWRRDHAIVAAFSIEEFATRQARLTDSPGFPDEYHFTRSLTKLSGKAFNEIPYKERKKIMMDGFANRLVDRYNELRTNPFLQRRVDRALTELCGKLRKQQQVNNFVFNAEVHYGRQA